MSLGDIYGKVTKSGNDRGVNAVTRSSEDGSEFVQGHAKDKNALDLERKRLGIKVIESKTIALHREIMNADLHKVDYASYRKKKSEIEAQIKTLDQSKHRLEDEIRRHEREVSIKAKRHL